MKSLFVRWLGAYGRGQSLAVSIKYELEQVTREVACEAISMRSGSCGEEITANVGLIVDRRAVKKFFLGDVWSVTDEASPTGRLKATRFGAAGRHTECFARPVYTGICVRHSMENLSPCAYNTVMHAARKYHLPIYTLASHEGNLRLAVYRRAR